MGADRKPAEWRGRSFRGTRHRRHPFRYSAGVPTLRVILSAAAYLTVWTNR